MHVINAVASAATYPAEGSNTGCQIAITPSGSFLTVTVLNNNVYCQIAQGTQGQIVWQNEFLLITSTIVFQNVQGVRFRDATAGSHGTVTAVLWEIGDPQPINFGPIFSAGIGGINVNFYKAAALVANEPGLNFVDGTGISTTVTDVAGSYVTASIADLLATALTTIGDLPYLTGVNTYGRVALGSTGGLLYAAAASPAYTAAGSTGNLLVVGPAWLANPAANGAVLLGQSGANPQWLAAVASGQLLVSAGTGTNPKWLAAPGANGALLVGQSAADAQWLAAAAAGTILVGTGAGANPKYLASGALGTILIGQGAADPSWLSAGTSGYVLTAGGAGVAPTWAAATGSTPGRLLATTVLTATASSTFTTGANTAIIEIELVAGGGGGGGCATGATNPQAASGGGGGGYAFKRFAVSPSTGYTYQCGALGAGGAAGANPGVVGASTTFTVGGTTVTAFGGSGGLAGDRNPTLGSGGGQVSTNGNLNAGGQAGGNGDAGSSGGTTPNVGGEGGGSHFGGGGSGGAGSGVGLPSANYGSGGGGAATNSATTRAGGNGSQGVILVREYS